MVEPLQNETKKNLEEERDKLKIEFNSIEAKLREFDKLVYDLKEKKEEIQRRLDAIDTVFREFKDDKRKAGY